MDTKTRNINYKKRKTDEEGPGASRSEQAIRGLLDSV